MSQRVVALLGAALVAYDDKSLIAEHLTQEVEVARGIGGAEVLAIVQDDGAALGVGLGQLAL